MKRSDALIHAADGCVAVFNELLAALMNGEAVMLVFADGRCTTFRTDGERVIRKQGTAN